MIAIEYKGVMRRLLLCMGSMQELLLLLAVLTGRAVRLIVYIVRVRLWAEMLSWVYVRTMRIALREKGVHVGESIE